MQHHSTSLKDFKVLHKLGEGSFSVVYKAIRLSDKKVYAIKKVKMNLLKPKERENALNEVRLLASINSDFIVAYKDAFIQENCLHVVMEFCEKGDISGVIKKHTKTGKHFPESEIWKALIQITKGLKHLHEMNILHRDLKCANIFIDANGTYKLGDMNVSKAAKKGLVYTQVGTPYYASPEIWSDKPYNSKCDIWSLACVLYEMAALKPPFRAMDMEGLYRKIKKGTFDRIPSKYSNELQNVLQNCLKVQARQRYDVDQILNHPGTQARIQDLEEESTSCSSNGNQSRKELLGTIKCPRNLFSLNGQLPKAQYQKKISEMSQEAPEPLKKIDEEQNEIKTRQNRIVSAGIRRPVDEYQLPKVNNNQQPPIKNRKNSVKQIKQPLVTKHDASNLPQIPQKQRRSLQNHNVKEDNIVKPPLFQEGRYNNNNNKQPRYLLPTANSRRNSRILDDKSQDSKNENRKDPLQYQNKNNKYEYLYLKNIDKEKQEQEKKGRPLSGLKKNLLPPKSQVSKTPQVNRKQFVPNYQNNNNQNIDKVTKSYDHQDQQLVNKLNQKEKYLLGSNSNRNLIYNNSNNNNQQKQDEFKGRGMNRHQSAKNSIIKSNINDIAPNYHKEYITKKQQDKIANQYYVYHNDKKYDPYEYVYKKNLQHEQNVIF